ncbi:MAG: alginate export family protein [Bryobacterales bacterium]|nr:alginate export family protein [Bryobacterales bacterium]
MRSVWWLACMVTVAAGQETVPTPRVTFSYGGQIRQRFEYFDHAVWGREAEQDRYLLQRYMLHGEMRVGSRLRVFGELKSGIEVGRKQGPRPADEDRLDVHQAFVDGTLWKAGKESLTMRAGRQELSFGSGRLVSFREGPNVRQSFDGARLLLEKSGWTVDAFATRPAETGRGIFDDSPDHTRFFWGLYATHAPRWLPKGNIDLYYLGLDRKRARFDAGTGRERRHSAGMRLWGRTEAWDYNYEAVYQGGRFAGGAIRAWTLASETGYRVKDAPLRPRFGLRADIASGDRNLADGTLGTFNALFPKGAYFSEADLLGPYNLMDLHPSVELRLTRTVKVTPDADFFWRQSTRDGIYSIPGGLLQSGRNARARYIGCHTSAQVEWQWNRRTSLTALYLHFFPGEFLRQAPPDRHVNFFALWISYKF